MEGYTRWGVEKYDGGEKGVSADEDRGAEGKEEEEEEGRKEKAVSTEEQPSTETKMLDEEGEMALQRPERDIQHPQRQLPRQQQDEGWRDWLREVGVNAAYAPMTVHHSLEDGILSEGVLGALGAVVGALSIGRAWRESA